MGSAHEALGSSKVVNIEDLRHLARRRLPRAVFDYLDGGADCEITLNENCSAFNKIYFRPSSAVAFEHVDLGIRILGHQLALPFPLAPIGYSRLMHPEGELAAARAAGVASSFPINLPGLKHAGILLRVPRRCTNGSEEVFHRRFIAIEQLAVEVTWVPIDYHTPKIEDCGTIFCHCKYILSFLRESSIMSVSRAKRNLAAQKE